jgi:hypothetical protein
MYTLYQRIGRAESRGFLPATWPAEAKSIVRRNNLLRRKNEMMGWSVIPGAAIRAVTHVFDALRRSQDSGGE